MEGLLFISHTTSRYSQLEGIECVLKGGCRQIQLRVKQALPSEVRDLCGKAKSLCAEYNADLYIDDYPDICLEQNLPGVHVGKTDMPADEVRKLVGEAVKIGGTANTLADIERLAPFVDYIGLGPYRFTTTKQNLSPVLGLQGYKEIVAESKKQFPHLPIVAIGGITAQDIELLLQTGVSAVAMSSAILNAADPIEETRKILTIINNIK